MRSIAIILNTPVLKKTLLDEKYKRHNGTLERWQLHV